MARTQRKIVMSQLCLHTPMKARLSANKNARTILAISQKDIHWLLRYDNAEPRQYKSGRIKVGRWNERVRAKRCDAVDWDSA